jgi:membrane fusion protein, multidrug efflux system
LLVQDAIPEQQLTTQEATVRQFEAIIKADQAAIDNAKLQLTYCHIVAPIGGRVGLRLVDAGNIIHASDPNGLPVITQLQPIAILFTLPEDALTSVLGRMRTSAPLTVDAYNRDRSKKIESGKLLTVDNAIDPNTGTMRLKATFANPRNVLFPNEFVNVRLLLETKHRQVMIPSVAMQRGPQGTYVYVVTPDRTAEVRVITLGITEGDMASVSSGLQAGEMVVTDGTDKLQPGSKVAVRQSAASIRGL